MRNTFLLKLIFAIIVCFIIGLLFGTLSRSVTFTDDNYISADVLDADIPLVPTPMGENKITEPFQNLEQEMVFPAADTAIQIEQTTEQAAETETQTTSEQSVNPVDVLNCDFKVPVKPVFSARPIKDFLALSTEPGSKVKLDLFFENTGNMTWFSANSACAAGPIVNLGTMRERDRASDIFGEAGWIANNRIAMQTPKVEPGQIGVFEFTSVMPLNVDIYREYFQLVAEGKEWIRDSEINIDFYAGEMYESQENLDLKSLYISSSMPFSELDLSGEKKIEIDLSEQKMHVYLDNILIRVFRVSTGAYKTPTPIGDFEISFKQKVRIAGGDIPYIMPLWQTVYRGVGLHALPSLGNARLRSKIKKLAPDEEAPVEWFKEDSLWTEAVDHIGRPVSHGCIRLLPEDARFMYEFTEEGTPISIRR